MLNHLFILIVSTYFLFSTVTGDLKVLYQWKYIDYVWKNNAHKQEAISNGNYNITKIYTIDVDRAKDGRFFVTTPRDEGVPATLSTISNESGDGGPLLKPYPDWSWYENKKKCKGITSVYRVTIDKCNRMWVLDTGKIGNDQICSAQVLIFDLSSDKLIRTISIPSEYSSNGNGSGLLVTPILETSGRNCWRSRLYIADVEGYGLVVSNGKNKLRRFTDKSFNAEPNHANFTIEGESFQLPDGLISLALEPKKRGHHSRRLFYRPLASLEQYYTGTKYFHGNLDNDIKPNYKKLNYTFPSQVSIQAFSKNGILFMGYTNPPSIACWNSWKNEMNSENVVIIAENKETLQFSSGLKVKDKELLISTNRLQKIMTGTQNFKEINYRILLEDNIDDLVKGTSCM